MLKKIESFKIPAHPSMLGVNQMLRDFGMTDNEIKSEDLVRDKIAEIEEDFDLIMIAERYNLLKLSSFFRVSDKVYGSNIV